MTDRKLLRLREVESRCGLKKSAIYQRVNEGRFPVPVKLGARSVAWRSDEIQQWIDERPRSISCVPIALECES